MTITFTYAVLLSAFGTGLILGLALGLFVMTTILRFFMRFKG